MEPQVHSIAGNYSLVVPRTIWDRLRAHLLEKDAERMAFGYCSASSSADGTRLVLCEVALPPDRQYSSQRNTRVVLGASETIPYLMWARGAAAFLDAHSHPFPAAPYPSLIDRDSALRQYAALQAPSPGALLTRIIMSSEGRVWAAVHTGPDAIHPIRRIQIPGQRDFEVLVPVNAGNGESAATCEADLRTLACLGKPRLSLVRGLRVAIIGIGGVGSLVARLLAGLVGELVLIDPDRVEPHNAPRIWYAGAHTTGSKVNVAARLLRRAFPHLMVRTCAESFPSADTTRLLGSADFLFVCPDHNAVRFAASRFAARYLIPLIEVGCGGKVFDGALSALGYHIRLQAPGGPCLTCNGLDVSKLEDPDTTKLKQRLGYIEGVEDIPGELATLTARAAADAVDVFQRYSTGYPAAPPLHLYGDVLHLRTLDLTDSYQSKPECTACGESAAWSPHDTGILIPSA